MQNFIQATAESLGVVGAQAAVVKGETVRSYAAGLADARHGTPVDDGTLFQIGSTTKLYTAAMLMRLADDGRLDIDAPVSGNLPEHDLGPVTARHLMSMTSGLDNGPYADTGRGDDCVAARSSGRSSSPEGSARPAPRSAPAPSISWPSAACSCAAACFPRPHSRRCTHRTPRSPRAASPTTGAPGRT
ncbi:serine hydrolase domain-containing protein [Nonomuraea sp. NPDC055795]